MMKHRVTVTIHYKSGAKVVLKDMKSFSIVLGERSEWDFWPWAKLRPLHLNMDTIESVFYETYVILNPFRLIQAAMED